MSAACASKVRLSVLPNICRRRSNTLIQSSRVESAPTILVALAVEIDSRIVLVEFLVNERETVKFRLFFVPLCYTNT